MNELRQQAMAVMTRWYAAWDAHDIDAISALPTDDASDEKPSLPCWEIADG